MATVQMFLADLNLNLAAEFGRGDLEFDRNTGVLNLSSIMKNPKFSNSSRL